MLASRTLPPIICRDFPSPPVATFINIPRRYVKSNMQAGNDRAEVQMEDAIAIANQESANSQRRKSSRLSDSRLSSISSAVSVRANEYPGPTSAPSSPRSSRKRAASVLDIDVHGARPANGVVATADSVSPQSAISNTSGEWSGQVCLCQPEPKIPRPRNAFILYRQHHQHAIVARNPGLANPDISKIIGEQWKAESQDQKLIWQTLAQEEKTKHQELYPDYRYQPRRTSRLGSGPQHTTFDKSRCLKCGGRNLKISPSSPFSTASTPTLPPLLPSSENSTPTNRYLPPMANSMSLESPAYRRVRPGPSGLSNIQVPPSPSVTESPSVYSPGTPGVKRRRYNYPPESNSRRGEAPYYSGHRRESSATNQRPSPPSTATMLPPPPRTPRDLRRGSIDLNVLVPDQHDQSRSVEAMVMSVPFAIKVKVLGRITPPLKDPGPTSPAISIRGAIIAIEGDEIEAVKELADWLNNFLGKGQDNEFRPRIFEAPSLPTEEKKDVSFKDYLDLINEWHTKSEKMVKYITTPVSSSDSDSEKEDGKGKENEASPHTSTEGQKKPVIILPTYQLHASNVYTSRIPIQDAYSPTDHWQWMATLWRGTVGPDLTIYVRSPDAAATPEGKEASPPGKLVELIDDYRLLTVRKEKGSKFDPAALRRVGFEVGEWIQTAANRASSV